MGLTVIFDMDGVLVDSEPIWRAAEIDVFGRYGLVLHEDECRRTMGLRIDEVVAHWVGTGRLVVSDRDGVAEAILDRVVELHRERPRPMAGAVEAVTALRRRRARLAVASSSPSRVIATVLDSIGMTRHFDVVHSAEDEDAGKPHPAVYLTTAARLGVDPGRCVAVEDSPNGVLAALAAGMRCIAVPEPGMRADPRIAGAHVVLDSLAELPAALDGGL